MERDWTFFSRGEMSPLLINCANVTKMMLLLSVLSSSSLEELKVDGDLYVQNDRHYF